MRNKLFAGALALAMTCTTVFSSVAPATVKAASVSTVQTQAAENSDEYVYCYAGLTWAEYWKAEGVMAAGDTTSSDALDAHSEKDKGAFDTVTRATVNHGLHRGSYQCSAIIKTEKNTDGYKVSHWSDDGKTIYFTDGTSAGWNKGTLTFADESTDKMTEYDVTGLKYVPVKVKSSDYEIFKKAYPVVEDGGVLQGGYGEANLKAYKVIAAVNKDTNGLKTAEKQADGSFTFTKRSTGSDSGIKDQTLKDQTLKTADLNSMEPAVKEASGSYGEFLRVDFTKNYGDLGANMQAVKWTYYGSDSTRTNALATYGTKFAADNWMHKAMGIQLGLTDSIRCQLPKGTDGTGYWSLTIYALGYADSTYNFEATADNIVKPSEEPGDATNLKTLYDSASKLNKADYTEASWKNFETEFNETTDLLAKENPTQAELDEQYTHLDEAIKALVKVTQPAEPTTEKKNDTTTASKSDTKPATPTTEKKNNTTTTSKSNTKPATTQKKNNTKPALKKSKVKLSKPVVKVGKTTKNKAKITWKKVKKATGYEIQYTTKSFSNKKTTKTIKISKAKVTSAQLKKLKKKTKYKVRIRAVYKKAGYQTVTSKWSAGKTIKTK